ncbi:integrase [Bacillus pseudomycoides]|nr:integrase [Bacillus pseudomycoides]PGA83528.1 integrase [Bacillus pseudomycoides]PHF34729.1 integrase [Bacillus pseudomycoides]
MLQEILNHSTPQITLKHIETNKEEKNNILVHFKSNRGTATSLSS